MVFAVAENAQFIPDVVKAKELIDAGAIGEVYFARANLWESTLDSEFAEVLATPITGLPGLLSPV